MIYRCLSLFRKCLEAVVAAPGNLVKSRDGAVCRMKTGNRSFFVDGANATEAKPTVINHLECKQ